MIEVAVINRTAKTFTDSFHGMNFEFAPNKKTIIPLAAAVHIFGFGLTDRGALEQRYRRRGFTNPQDGADYFKNFTLEKVEYVAKEDAEETEALKVKLEESDAKITALEKELDALRATNESLSKKVEKAEKKGK